MSHTGLEPVLEAHGTGLEPVPEAHDTGLEPVPEAHDTGLEPVLEAVLVVSDVPVVVDDIAAALDVAPADVLAALTRLGEQFTAAQRGFRLREVTGGWQLFAAPEHRAAVESVLRDAQPVRLSQAALETLAIVAYLQPVARSRVAAVRGVSVDAVMRTLLARGLVAETGQGETGALLYSTTALFLDRLGIRSLEELPSLAPLLPEFEEVRDLDAAAAGGGAW